MKILLHGTRMDLISGHSRPAYELAAHLRDAGHEVRILSSRLTHQRQTRHSRLKKSESYLDLPATERVFGSTADLIRPTRDLRRFLTEAAGWADIAHGFSFWGSSLIARLLDGTVPSILTLNTLPKLPWGDLSSQQLSLFNSAFRSAELVGLLTPGAVIRTALRTHTRLVSWTRYLRQEIVRYGVSSEMVSVVEVGFDSRRFPTLPHSGSAGPIILFYGIATAMRGATALLMAFQTVLAEHRNARLIIADRGFHQVSDRRRHTQEIRKLRAVIDRLSLSQSVSLDGFAEDIPSLIDAVDIAALPFQSGFGYAHPPLTVLECLVMGKPVVSTRVGSLPEIITNDQLGMVVERGDPQELSTAILETLSRERPENRELRRRTVEENHDWSLALAALLPIYKSAARSSESRRPQATRSSE